MPPRTLNSAVALVGLTSLAMIEAGGCSKRPESLRSVTRAGLPLVAQATGSISADAVYSLADYGVMPLAGLSHLCVQYELGPHGELVTRDLFSGSMPPSVLEQSLLRAKRPERRSASITLRVQPFSADRLPLSCKALAHEESRSLLWASRVL